MNPLNIGKIAKLITEDPDLFNGSEEEEKGIEDLFTDRDSFLGDEVYYGILGIIQQELAKYDCKLDRHRKRSHTTGMDIDITVNCTKNSKELQKLRDKLEESMPHKKWDFDNKPSSYVLAAINPDVDERIVNEYGLDFVAHQWSESEIVTMTVSKPRPDSKPADEFEENGLGMGGDMMGMEDPSLDPEGGLGEPQDDLELSEPGIEPEGEGGDTEGAEELTDDELLGIRSEVEKDEEESKGLEY